MTQLFTGQLKLIVAGNSTSVSTSTLVYAKPFCMVLHVSLMDEIQCIVLLQTQTVCINKTPKITGTAAASTVEEPPSQYDRYKS